MNVLMLEFWWDASKSSLLDLSLIDGYICQQHFCKQTRCMKTMISCCYPSPVNRVKDSWTDHGGEGGCTPRGVSHVVGTWSLQHGVSPTRRPYQVRRTKQIVGNLKLGVRISKLCSEILFLEMIFWKKISYQKKIPIMFFWIDERIMMLRTLGSNNRWVTTMSYSLLSDVKSDTLASYNSGRASMEFSFSWGCCKVHKC